MSETKAFIDTSILIYLLSEESNKADRAETIVRAGGTISLQVLNELANVTHRKLAMLWMEINELLSLIRSVPVLVGFDPRFDNRSVGRSTHLLLVDTAGMRYSTCVFLRDRIIDLYPTYFPKQFHRGGRDSPSAAVRQCSDPEQSRGGASLTLFAKRISA